MERRIFPKRKDAKGRSYEELRWSRFKHLSPVCLSGMQVVRGLECDPYETTWRPKGRFGIVGPQLRETNTHP